jgi:hypothetical protein
MMATILTLVTIVGVALLFKARAPVPVPVPSPSSAPASLPSRLVLGATNVMADRPEGKFGVLKMMAKQQQFALSALPGSDGDSDTDGEDELPTEPEH